MAKPTKQTKEDAREAREEREEEEREMRAEEEREASAKPAKAPAAKPMSDGDEPPADRTAIYRHPKATTLQETPEPGPIDPDWEKPDPKSFSVRREGIPEPEISAFSAGDSEEHGTEFPPRLDALGYADAMPELKSKILGKPAEPVELPKDATATFRANQHNEAKEASSRRGSEIK